MTCLANLEVKAVCVCARSLPTDGNGTKCLSLIGRIKETPILFCLLQTLTGLLEQRTDLAPLSETVNQVGCNVRRQPNAQTLGPLSASSEIVGAGGLTHSSQPSEPRHRVVIGKAEHSKDAADVVSFLPPPATKEKDLTGIPPSSGVQTHIVGSCLARRVCPCGIARKTGARKAVFLLLPGRSSQAGRCCPESLSCCAFLIPSNCQSSALPEYPNPG